MVRLLCGDRLGPIVPSPWESGLTRSSALDRPWLSVSFIEANVAEPRFLLLTAVRRTAPEPVLDTVLVEPRNSLEPD